MVVEAKRQITYLVIFKKNESHPETSEDRWSWAWYYRGPNTKDWVYRVLYGFGTKELEKQGDVVLKERLWTGKFITFKKAKDILS